MGLKKYILFSIIFIVAVGAYVYSFNGGMFTLSFFGVPVSLYIAVWVILPAAVIIIASVLHILFYNVKGYFSYRNLQKDYKNYIQYSKARILGVDSSAEFKTKWFKLPVKMLKHFKFDATKDPSDIEDEEIKNTILDLKKIENGESIELKKYKLSKDNYFVKKNMLNKLTKDKKYSEEILKNCTDKESKICKKAFEIYVTFANYENIRKQGYKVTKDIFEKLLERMVDKDDLFKMDSDEIFELIKEFKYTKQEFLKLAKKFKKVLNPEATISLFEKLSNENELSLQAYLYILFEFQMIDKAREILENVGKNECEKFKYFLFLRDAGKNFDIDLFFDI